MTAAVPAWLLTKVTSSPGVLASLLKPTLDDRWNTSAAALHTFTTEQGRWPYRNSAEPSEVRLNVWLATQRRAHRATPSTLKPWRRARLDLVAAGWDRTFVDRWETNADQLGMFRLAEHRWPYPFSDDVTERQLGVWHVNQRALASPARAMHLDAHAPGWNSRGTSLYPKHTNP